GFSNYYFNEQAQKNLWTAFRKHGDFTALKGDWSMKGKLAQAREVEASFALKERGSADGKSLKVLGEINEIPFGVEPLNPSERAENFKLPNDSGGFLMALYHYRQLLVSAEKGFVGEFSHGGTEPFYLRPSGNAKLDFVKDRVLC